MTLHQRPVDPPLAETKGIDAPERHVAVVEPTVIDAAFLTRLSTWTFATFGPPSHRGPEGPLDHLRHELVEIEEHPGDLMEWVDAILLSFDGAARGGHSPQDVLDALESKATINRARTWPDWRGIPGHLAISHVRADGEIPVRIELDDHVCDTGHFDRAVCPEPCGAMHSFCSFCGIRQDACAHHQEEGDRHGQAHPDR